MGNSQGGNSHPMDAQFDVAYYRRIKPQFVDNEIISIYELFKSMEPDEYGNLEVSKILYTFRESPDREQLKE